MEKNNAPQRFTMYEEMAVTLGQAEMLMVLLFEEINDLFLASQNKDPWMAVACSRRAEVFESISSHVFDDIRTIKGQLLNLVDQRDG